MIIAFIVRATDVRAATRPLTAHLADLLKPSGPWEERVLRMTDALQAQAAALDDAAGQTLDRVAKAEAGLRLQAESLTALHGRDAAEIERIETGRSSGRAGEGQCGRIQGGTGAR